MLNSEIPHLLCFDSSNRLVKFRLWDSKCWKSVQKPQFFQKYRHLKNQFWVVFGPISPNSNHLLCFDSNRLHIFSFLEIELLKKRFKKV